MDNKFGKILVEIRNKNHWTQKDLANKINVSDKAISRWETGISIPHVETLVRISKLFKVPLQDLIVASADLEGDESLVHDVIKEFTKRDKEKSDAIKIITVVALLIVIILITSIIFTKSYNRFKVYDVYLESKDLRSKVGVYIETRIKDELYLKEIKFRNDVIKQNDIVNVDLFYLDNNKEHILQSFTSLDEIRFSNYAGYSVVDDLSKYFNNLYLRVRVINSSNAKEYIAKLDFKMNFTNNKLIEKNIKNELVISNSEDGDSYSTDSILKQQGFKLINNTFYQKKLNAGYINFFIDSKIINAYYKKESFVYNYVLLLNTNSLEVKIFNSENIEVENYIYDYGKSKVTSCNIGKCNNYKEAMDFLNNNILKHIN